MGSFLSRLSMLYIPYVFQSMVPEDVMILDSGK